jgi:hypothetical protein
LVRAGRQARRGRERAARPRANPVRGEIMRGVLLWLLGIPLPIILLLYLFNVL